ncbi:MAG: S26 family signal peptidase [Thermoplasmata archaeon HGW-Thermoplasmata-1]|nr:MAG: S26 family signal peptidase [Thermoplasmata archaeon HGW-Thermoplasmata-1]
MKSKTRETLRGIWKGRTPYLAALRDVAIAIAAVAIIMSALWGYTGQPFPKTAPMVVIESGSMMHDDSPYGKLGTIDPGDLVLVKRTGVREDVATYAYESNAGGARQRYGTYGDVIIYRPYNAANRTPIIHRAVLWLDYDEDTGSYDLPELGLYGQSGTVTIEGYGYNGATVRLNLAALLSNPAARHDGFITLGDNNNGAYDQGGSICTEPILPEWIIGKSRGEIPWFGLIKLAIQGNNVYPQEGWSRVGRAYAPTDLWVCLGICIAAIVTVPIAVDVTTSIIEKRKAGKEKEENIEQATAVRDRNK